MSKKELKYAFNTLISVTEGMRCDELHHGHNQSHEWNEVCPVEESLSKQANIVREYMKENDI